MKESIIETGDLKGIYTELCSLESEIADAKNTLMGLMTTKQESE